MIRPLRLEDHFATGEAFEACLADAVFSANAEGLDKTLTKLVGIKKAWEAYGMRMRMSIGDRDFLLRVAGREIPAEDCGKIH